MATISVKSPKSEQEVIINVDVDKLLTDEVVILSLAERMLLTDIGNKVRVLLNSGKTPDECIEFANSYEPGVKRAAGPKKISAKQVTAAAPSMTPEELKAIIEAARAQLEALGQ